MAQYAPICSLYVPMCHNMLAICSNTPLYLYLNTHLYAPICSYYAPYYALPICPPICLNTLPSYIPQYAAYMPQFTQYALNIRQYALILHARDHGTKFTFVLVHFLGDNKSCSKKNSIGKATSNRFYNIRNGRDW